MKDDVALIDFIIVTELKRLRRDLKNDLKKDRPLIFADDPDEDKKLIKEHIKAMDVVIRYFTK